MVTKGKKVTCIDLFAGVGGMSLGFLDAGFKLLCAVDFDEDCANTFRKNHKSIPFICKDIKKINKNAFEKYGISSVDVVIAGMPCQSFSFAGKRNRKQFNNQEDDRNYLFKEAIRISKLLKPKAIVFENVKGILSLKNGEIKQRILSTLKRNGYTTDFRILDASEFNTPQKRERVVFIANRIGVKNIFPKPRKNTFPKTVGDAFKNIKGFNHNPRKLKGVVLERVKLIRQGQNWKALPPRLRTKSIHSGAYGRLSASLPSRTLLTRFDTPSVGYVIHPTKHRTITVREAARLQGFPDSFEFTGSLLSQCRQVGNAVPVHMSKQIARSVRKML